MHSLALCTVQCALWWCWCWWCCFLFGQLVHFSRIVVRGACRHRLCYDFLPQQENIIITTNFAVNTVMALFVHILVHCNRRLYRHWNVGLLVTVSIIDHLPMVHTTKQFNLSHTFWYKFFFLYYAGNTVFLFSGLLREHNLRSLFI